MAFPIKKTLCGSDLESVFVQIMRILSSLHINLVRFFSTFLFVISEKNINIEVLRYCVVSVITHEDTCLFVHF